MLIIARRRRGFRGQSLVTITNWSLFVPLLKSTFVTHHGSAIALTSLTDSPSVIINMGFFLVVVGTTT